jgi:hypothetical protein
MMFRMACEDIDNRWNQPINCMNRCTAFSVTFPTTPVDYIIANPDGTNVAELGVKACRVPGYNPTITCSGARDPYNAPGPGITLLTRDAARTQVGTFEVSGCPAANTDCTGDWSCTTACEAAADRVWVETIPQLGTGAACPTEPPADTADCAPGEDQCLPGCMDEGATNYDETATSDDGSCVCDGFRQMQHNRAVCSSCSGDMDGNDKVNVYDIMALLGDFGLCDPRLISDGTNDGCVGIQDLLLLLVEFGRDCSACESPDFAPWSVCGNGCGHDLSNMVEHQWNGDWGYNMAVTNSIGTIQVAMSFAGAHLLSCTTQWLGSLV